MPKEKGYRSEAAKRLQEHPPGPVGSPVDPAKSDKENDAAVRAKRLEEYERLPKRRSALDEADDGQLLKGYQKLMKGE